MGWPLNLLLFGSNRRRFVTTVVPISRCAARTGRPCPSNRRLQEAYPRDGFKRCVLEVSPRGGSKRRLKEPAGDVQEEALSSKRFIQKVAPRDGSKRRLK